MEKYVRIYDKNLPDKYCDELIAMYNKLPELRIRYDYEGHPNMDQFDFSIHRRLSPDFHNVLINHALNSLDLYRKDVPEAKFWPEDFSFEDFRVKHYAAGGHDRFDEHVDVSCLNSSRRFLIFFWYLNDVEEGGETEITNLGIKVKPEKGKLLIFPPFWMFPHIGHPVIKGDKYLLSSYMHLDERSK